MTSIARVRNEAQISKTSVVQKGGNIKPAIIKDGSMQYDPLEDHTMDDPRLLEDMVRQIDLLDKQGHEQIYKVLRKSKPKTFFAANSIDTRFNIYGLSAHERQELARTIKLCLQDMDRKRVLADATCIHREEIKRLDQKLHINSLDDTMLDEQYSNPSEAEKIKNMLQMNA